MNPDQNENNLIAEQFAEVATMEQPVALMAEPPEAPVNKGWQRTSKEEKFYQRHHYYPPEKGKLRNGEQKRRAAVVKNLTASAIKQAKRLAGGRKLTQEELGRLQQQVAPMLEAIRQV